MDLREAGRARCRDSLVAAACMCLLATGASSTCLDYPSFPRTVSVSGEHVRDVAIKDHYALVAAGDFGLQVFDVANPEAPSLVAAVPPQHYDTDFIEISGDMAAIVDNTLAWFADISDPTSPVPLGSVALSYSVEDVAVENSLLFVSGGFASGGFSIVDFSDPHDPRLAGSIGFFDAGAVDAEGDFAYVTDYPDILAIDVSQPESPAVVGATTLPVDNDLLACGSALYVAAGGTTWIIDISDPSSPHNLGWVAGGGYHLDRDGDFLYGAGPDGLSILSIHDPVSPFLVGTLAIRNGGSRVAARGQYAYLAAWSAGMRIVDLGLRKTPPVAATFEVQGGAFDVAISEGLAYVACDQTYSSSAGLEIWDVATPETPVFRGRIDTPGWGGPRVDASGSFACLADDTGLYVIDVGDPTRPTLAMTLTLFNFTLDVALRGDVAYVVGGYPFEMIVVDLSRLGNRPVRSRHPMATGGWTAAVIGDLLCVGTQNRLFLFDVDDPRSPVLLTNLWVGSRVLNIAPVGETLLYVATHQNDVVIVDISDPAVPVLLGSFATAGEPTAIGVGKRYGFIADNFAGVQIVDVADAENPRIIGGACVGGVSGMAVQNGFAVCAQGEESTLKILSPQCGTGSGEGFLRPRTETNEPAGFALDTWPNPFAREISAVFSVPAGREVDLAIYDVAGRRLRALTRGRFPAGEHRIVWDGTANDGMRIASGVYFLRLQSEREVLVRRIVRRDP
jgi:hypothetical protein